MSAAIPPTTQSTRTAATTDREITRAPEDEDDREGVMSTSWLDSDEVVEEIVEEAEELPEEDDRVDTRDEVDVTDDDDVAEEDEDRVETRDELGEEEEEEDREDEDDGGEMVDWDEELFGQNVMWNNFKTESTSLAVATVRKRSESSEVTYCR